MEEAVSQLEACRICANFFLSAEMEFLPLYGPQNEFLVFMHNELKAWQINIVENDGLPQAVCGNCVNRFYSIHTFRQECEQAQQKFHEALLEQCTENPTENLAQLQLMSQQLDMAPLGDYMSGEVPVDVAEVVVGLEAAQEVAVPNLEQEVANFAIYEQNFADLRSVGLVETPLNTGQITQIVDSVLIHEPTAVDDMDTLILPSVPPQSINLPTQNHNVPLSKEAESILSSQIIETEMENIVQQDLEEMLEELDSCTDSELMEVYDADADPNTPHTRLSGNPLACQYCYCPPTGHVDYLIFANCDLLSQHFFDAHDPNLPYSCPFCTRIYRTARHRDIHVKQLHDVTPTPGEQCPYCLKKLRTRQDWHEYSCKYVGDWECSDCGETFKRTQLHRFRAHERQHDPSKQLTCPKCPRVFQRRSHFEDHKRLHELTVFNSDYELRRHKYQSHNGELPVQCEYCKKGFVTGAFLNRHVQHFHFQEQSDDNQKSIVTCVTCNTVFSSLHKLRSHLQRARNNNGICINIEERQEEQRRLKRQGVFQCPHCARRFHLKTQLEKHLNTHDERLRPHQCQECHVRCRTAYELQQHANIAHMQIKPFECAECKKTFGYKKDLTVHMLSHRELTVHCIETDCDFVCKSGKALSGHIRHKHQLMPCNYCNESFTRQRLILHLRQVHRKDIAAESLSADQSLSDYNDNNNTSSSASASASASPHTRTANDVQRGKVRVEMVNSEPSIPSLALQDAATPNEFKPDVQLDEYFVSSLLDPDHEIVVA